MTTIPPVVPPLPVPAVVAAVPAVPLGPPAVVPEPAEVAGVPPLPLPALVPGLPPAGPGEPVVPALVVALPAVGVGSVSPSPSAALPEQAAMAPRIHTNGRYLRMIFRVGLNRARALHRVMPGPATSIT